MSAYDVSVPGPDGGVALLTLPLGSGTHITTASCCGDNWFGVAPPATLTTRIWRAGF